MEQNFARYEKKFMLNPVQYQFILHAMSDKMTDDEYGASSISNIYYDTDDYQLIRASIEKPVYKEKFRLRAYGHVTDDDEVFLEIKKKYDGIVNKRRVMLPLKEAKRYMDDGVYPSTDCQIMREINYSVKRYKLKPKAFISYERQAFYDKEDKDVRITFDRNICARDWNLDLAKKDMTIPLLSDGQILMEIKTGEAMPLWLSSLLSELEIYQTSYSKYGEFYKMYLYKEAAEYNRPYVVMGNGGVNCA